MTALSELQRAFWRYRLGLADGSECIDWAVARLVADEERNDLEIKLLAGATKYSEIIPLVETILRRYGGESIDESFLWGKFICELHSGYQAGKIKIEELDRFLSWIYDALNYPSWLVMLSRNCEYAIDVEPFVKPFQEEFNYVAKLWQEAASTEEFMRNYDRNISNTHDFRSR